MNPIVQHMQAMHQPRMVTQQLSSSCAHTRRNRQPVSRLIVRGAAKTADKKVTDDQVELGKSGIKVNALCIGAWQWGDKSFWGYDTYGNYGEDQIRKAYDGVVDAGLNFIDTAEVYGAGKSEKFLRDFQRQTGTNVKIATKFAPLPWRWGADAPVKALKGSLDRLGASSVELYQQHWPGFPIVNSWQNDNYYQGLAECQKQGLAKAVGVSNHNEKRMKRAYQVMQGNGVTMATNQVQFSLLYKKFEKEGLLAAAKEMGITIIAYSPLAQGLLSGNYKEGSPKPSGPRAAIFSDDRLRSIQPLISTMRDIGQAQGGKTPAQVAINWNICKGTIPIVGAKSYQQAEAAGGMLGWRLTADQVAELDRVSDKTPSNNGLPFENF